MKSSRAIPWAIGISIVIFSVSGAIYWLAFRAPVEASRNTVDVVSHAVREQGDAIFDTVDRGWDTAKRVASDVKNGTNLNGRITIGKTMFSEAERDISEYAVKERTLIYTYKWQHEWAGSTKELEAKGTFLGKAGYDLAGKWASPLNPWSIDVSEDGKLISVHLPNPSILSMEMTRYEIIRDENGLWNKISQEDRQHAVNALQQGARGELEKSGSGKPTRYFWSRWRKPRGRARRWALKWFGR